MIASRDTLFEEIDDHDEHDVSTTTFRTRQHNNEHLLDNETKLVYDVEEGPPQDAAAAPTPRRLVKRIVRALRGLSHDWYWFLITGYLIYLAGFGPVLWYVRIIALVAVIVVSGATYVRWIAKLSRPR